MALSIQENSHLKAEWWRIKAMNAARKPLKVIGSICVIFVATIAILSLWWYAPVSVKAANIVKIIDPDIAADQVRFCNSFAMTPDEFRAYWKDVTPIFEYQFHEYSFGSCHFKTTENNREFAIGIGGVGIVSKGDTSYYYVKKNAKSDFADMK